MALATVLTLLLVLVGCGSNDSEEARELVRKALRKDVRSADVSLALGARLDGLGVLGEEPLRLTLAGPLRSNGRRRLPSLDWKHAEGAGRRLNAREVLGSPELRSQLRPGQRLRKLSDEQSEGVEDAVEDRCPSSCGGSAYRQGSSAARERGSSSARSEASSRDPARRS